MHHAFDTIASDYDTSFTKSIIGTAQREIVYRYLDKFLPEKKSLGILELNSGTGEDAIWFVKKGHQVLATDISEKMVGIIREKVDEANLSHQIRVRRQDITLLQQENLDEKYDLIFSNFGGINCIQPAQLNKLPHALRQLLKLNGRLILVLMPKYCLWEAKYFLLKLNIKSAFRRYSNKGTTANLNGIELKIYYYTPGQIKKVFKEYFNVVAVKPVGFFIPPSYLEKHFASNRKTFNLLKRFENLIANQSYLATFSDHYLIDLRVHI